MTSIILSGSDEVSREEAEATSRHYTPGPQENVEETPEVEDRTPVSDAQREALDEATRPTFEPIASDQQNGERAATFEVPGGWVSPVVRQRNKSAMMLPNFGSITDLEQRIGAVLRYAGAPREIADLGQQARDAVAAARKAHEGSRHDTNRRFAVDQDAKDAVILEIARATAAVGALEALARDGAVRDEWFDGLVADLPTQRQKAARALDDATKAYAQWRRAIADADALARKQGRFGEWHMHPDRLTIKPLDLIAELQKARDIAKSDDDWVNGDYLTKEYDGIPPHTMAALEKSAQSAGGSFVEQVYLRLKHPHPADGPARDTIAERDLRIIHTRPIPNLAPDQPRR